MNTLTGNDLVLVKDTVELFNRLRENITIAMQKLWEVKESGAWQGMASSWGEFVERDLGISQGFASKLLTTHKYYVIDGGMSRQQLEGVDYEKLYAARTLPGTPEEQVEMAKTLSRRELKETKNDATGHEHEPETITLCKKCGMRL